MDAGINIVIKILIPYSNCIVNPYYLNPDYSDNGKQHHKDEPHEFFPVHDSKLTYHTKTRTCFNFSLTLINLILTASGRL
jgi:hypothetical protein